VTPVVTLDGALRLFHRARLHRAFAARDGIASSSGGFPVRRWGSRPIVLAPVDVTAFHRDGFRDDDRLLADHVVFRALDPLRPSAGGADLGHRLF
jgi:hypothetical protein